MHFCQNFRFLGEVSLWFSHLLCCDVRGSSTSVPAVTKVDGLPPASSLDGPFRDFGSVENRYLEI